MSTIEQKTVGDSLKVGKYVGKEHVDTVIRTYKQERWIYNTERLGKEDSLSVWYSAEELEAFIQKIKASGGNGVPTLLISKGILSMRVVRRWCL